MLDALELYYAQNYAGIIRQGLGYTEVDMSVDDCADCFDLSNTSERCELDMHSCMSQSSSQEVLGAPQKGAQVWEVGVDDLSTPVSVKGQLKDNSVFGKWSCVPHLWC